MSATLTSGAANASATPAAAASVVKYYASYDPNAAQPVPVSGWYRSDASPGVNFAAAGFVEITAAQWAARYQGDWAVSAGAMVAYVPPAPPAPTLAQQAGAMIAAGLTIKSTGTPALDGVYSVDAAAQQNIQAVQIYIQANGKFPGSSGTYPWLDKAGQPHVFPTVAEFSAFATVVADFVADLKMIQFTGAGTLPAASATIP